MSCRAQVAQRTTIIASAVRQPGRMWFLHAQKLGIPSPASRMPSPGRAQTSAAGSPPGTTSSPARMPPSSARSRLTNPVAYHPPRQSWHVARSSSASRGSSSCVVMRAKLCDCPEAAVHTAGLCDAAHSTSGSFRARRSSSFARPRCRDARRTEGLRSALARHWPTAVDSKHRAKGGGQRHRRKTPRGCGPGLRSATGNGSGSRMAEEAARPSGTPAPPRDRHQGAAGRRAPRAPETEMRANAGCGADGRRARGESRDGLPKSKAPRFESAPLHG